MDSKDLKGNGIQPRISTVSMIDRQLNPFFHFPLHVRLVVVLVVRRCTTKVQQATPLARSRTGNPRALQTESCLLKGKGTHETCSGFSVRRPKLRSDACTVQYFHSFDDNKKQYIFIIFNTYYSHYYRNTIGVVFLVPVDRNARSQWLARKPQHTCSVQE